MSDPQKYTRDYSFTDYQASNPSAPLPGLQVDAELEDVEASIGEIVDAIKDVRRSDGKLKNGIVTVDSLSPQVAAGVGAGALAAQEAAEAAAVDAEESRDEAEGFSTAASGSATAASGYASTALTHRNAASGFADDSAAAATLSQTARDYAYQWSSQAEGVDVDDGVNPIGKSAYHWAQVALGAATGALPDNSVSTTKIVDGAVTRAKLATAVTDELDGKAPVATTVTLTGSQTLTNKSLTSPTLDTPTLVLKQSSSPSQTAEGAIEWDTDDNAIVVGDGAGRKIFRANGWELIGDFSGSSTVCPVIGLSVFRKLRVTGFVYPSASPVQIFLRTSTDNGASYDSGASDYAFQAFGYQNTASGSSAGVASLYAIGTGDTGPNNGVHFSIEMEDFNVAAYLKIMSRSSSVSSGNIRGDINNGYRIQATARDAFAILPASGTMTYKITVEGFRG